MRIADALTEHDREVIEGLSTIGRKRAELESAGWQFRQIRPDWYGAHHERSGVRRYGDSLGRVVAAVAGQRIERKAAA